MTLIEALPFGQYRPGTSPLYRVDPRVKLCLIPLLIMTCFATRSGWGLAGLMLGTCVLVVSSGVRLGELLRPVRSLRVVLLMTILLHVLFSPGRTLFGLSWLSLDGLLFGLGISVRLFLAVLVSTLLTLTTSPEQILNGLQSLLSPFRVMKRQVESVLLFLGLVLYFIPVLGEELTSIRNSRGHEGAGGGKGLRGLRGRIGEIRRLVVPLLLALVTRAEGLVTRIRSGEDVFPATEGSVNVYPGSIQWAVAGVWVVFLLGLWWC